MPLSELDSLMAALHRQLLLTALVAIGLTLAFGYLVRGLISVPLRNIAALSKKLAAGDLSQRSPITGDEEIAALGGALNTMAKNLSEQMQALSEGKQRLESIVAAMTEAVMVLDRDGTISLANTALQTIAGANRALIGNTPFEVFRQPAIEDAVRRVMQYGASEVIELSAAGGRTVQANVASVPGSDGISAVVVVFHDLTEIRRTERMRRDFVANVSHEFKTPLTSIRGYAETLLTGALDNKQIAPDFVRTIERNARYLESLVADLLTLARLEAELPASLEAVNIRDVVDERLASRMSVLQERQIQVINDCPSIEVRADRSRLSTAISNLIDNAIHYNKPNGEIRIYREASRDSFELSISDTGSGIPSEDLSRIFERFYRVDKARARESGGTGLGLAIVKHAIESQGGSISVSSRLGAGSTFTIKLPWGGTALHNGRKQWEN